MSSRQFIIITRYLFILGSGILIACKKEKAIDLYPDMEGYWMHHENGSYNYALLIGADGRGYIDHFNNGKFESSTQTRKWLLKENVLTFGWLGQNSKKTDEKFIIDSLPQTALASFIITSDTINTGDRYMWLDQKLFICRE